MNHIRSIILLLLLPGLLLPGYSCALPKKESIQALLKQTYKNIKGLGTNVSNVVDENFDVNIQASVKPRHINPIIAKLQAVKQDDIYMMQLGILSTYLPAYEQLLVKQAALHEIHEKLLQKMNELLLQETNDLSKEVEQLKEFNTVQSKILEIKNELGYSVALSDLYKRLSVVYGCTHLDSCKNDPSRKQPYKRHAGEKTCKCYKQCSCPRNPRPCDCPQVNERLCSSVRERFGLTSRDVLFFPVSEKTKLDTPIVFFEYPLYKNASIGVVLIDVNKFDAIKDEFAKGGKIALALAGLKNKNTVRADERNRFIGYAKWLPILAAAGYITYTGLSSNEPSDYAKCSTYCVAAAQWLVSSLFNSNIVENTASQIASACPRALQSMLSYSDVALCGIVTSILGSSVLKTMHNYQSSQDSMVADAIVLDEIKK